MIEKQINKLDQYLVQLNSDMTLKHKIEKINLLLTNQVKADRDVMNDSGDLDAPNILNVSDLSRNESGPVNYELVEMHLIELRKFIATSTFNWNTKMSEFFKKKFEEDESNINSVDKAKKDEEGGLSK